MMCSCGRHALASVKGGRVKAIKGHDLCHRCYRDQQNRLRAAALAVVVMISGCAHRVCGRLESESIAAFHRNNPESAGANESSVEDLAARNWLVCIDNGVAKIEAGP